MSKQVTINQSFFKKLARLEEIVGDKTEEKLMSLGSYAVQISPVDTSAYVQSMSFRPIGSGGGRMRSSNNRTPLPSAAKQDAKDQAKAELANDLKAYRNDILERGGAVLKNRAPHANDVEDKYDVFRRTKGRFK